MDIKELIKLINGKTTAKQVERMLNANGIDYTVNAVVRNINGKNKTDIDFWVNDIRIYKPHFSREYTAQAWERITMKQSNAPTFF